MREAGADIGGLDLHVDSDVPIGAGLSSSAALECSVALALRDLYGLSLSRQDLASLAQRAENDFVGVPTGIMDQTASMRCQVGHALFLDTRSLEVRQVPFKLEPSGLTLFVVNTGVKHALGNSAYAERRRDCLRAADEIGVPALRDIDPEKMDAALAGISDEDRERRARHIFSEQARVLEVVRLLEAGRPVEVGPVLTAGHRSLRYDFEVSCAELDTVVDVAVANGAFGARMTGGGFGGSALVLLELGAVDSVTRLLRAHSPLRVSPRQRPSQLSPWRERPELLTRPSFLLPRHPERSRHDAFAFGSPWRISLASGNSPAQIQAARPLARVPGRRHDAGTLGERR